VLARKGALASGAIAELVGALSESAACSAIVPEAASFALGSVGAGNLASGLALKAARS
jgi:hypothetical protein